MEMYNTIKLLTDAFDIHELKYQLQETDRYQAIHVPFGIKNGPFVDVRFISTNHKNDTLVRITNLVNKVPEEKRHKILEVCNVLNHKYRFLKFLMDSDNDVHVEYDFPVNSGNDCLGEMAVEIFIRTIQILNEGYVLIAKALYAEDGNNPDYNADADETKDIIKLLKNNHDGINITISKAPPSENQDN